MPYSSNSFGVRAPLADVGNAAADDFDVDDSFFAEMEVRKGQMRN